MVGVGLACAAAVATTLTRPPHYDEANFLALARGARLDAWRPHAVRINWQGVEQPAFEVLSNPPGIAWWLAPWLDAPIAVQRLVMLPWAALAAWGMFQLGRRCCGDGPVAAALLVSSPIVLLSASALLPDAPLLGLAVAGMALWTKDVDDRRGATVAVRGALVVGLACLFRYSALPLPLVLAFYAVLRGRPDYAALAAVGWAPLGALAAHDLHAYGAVHLAAMGRFQSIANTPEDLGHKAVAASCFLGGAAILPVFRWRAGAAVGAALGALAAAPWGVGACGFGAAGGAVLGATVEADGVERRDRAWVRAWALGGALFLLSLRFTAARYWLPFLPAVVLAVGAHRYWPAALFAQAALGVGLALDDAASARAQERLVAALDRAVDAAEGAGARTFVGHWGWQWALERRGWRALDEGSTPPSGAVVAIPTEAWPQAADVRCARVLWSGEALPAAGWLPRGHSAQARANLHANWISGPPPARTVRPWAFATDPYERAVVCAD